MGNVFFYSGPSHLLTILVLLLLFRMVPASHDDCPPGRYYDGFCRDCLAGRYSDVTRALSCQICPAGKSSREAATICGACNPGTYQPSDGASECIDCPAGKAEVRNKKLDGMLYCVLQGSGEYSIAGQAGMSGLSGRNVCRRILFYRSRKRSMHELSSREIH